jgi:hypothetical protein
METTSSSETSVYNKPTRLLAYADDVNLLGYDIDTVKKNITLNDARKEVGLEVSRSNLSICCRRNRDIKIAQDSMVQIFGNNNKR